MDMNGHPIRLLSAFFVASIVLAASTGSASASLGIGVQSNPVILASVARPGASYRLPPVFVVDNGTEPESVGVRVERLSKGTGITIPPGWVQSIGPTVQLRPQQSAYLHLLLTVPANAASGRYFSDLVVTAVVPQQSGRTNFSAAAATDLEFTVSKRGGHSGLPHVAPWVWGVGGGVIVLGIGILLIRRSGLTIRIDRTPPKGADRAREAIARGPAQSGT